MRSKTFEDMESEVVTFMEAKTGSRMVISGNFNKSAGSKVVPMDVWACRWWWWLEEQPQSAGWRIPGRLARRPHACNPRGATSWSNYLKVEEKQCPCGGP